MTLRAAKHRASSLEMIGQCSQEQQIRDREKRITKMFSYIFLTFLLCFTPWAIISEVDPMPPSTLGWVHMATYIVSWSSVIVNPIIYSVVNRNYQEAFMQLGRKIVPSLSISRTTETSAVDIELINRKSGEE